MFDILIRICYLVEQDKEKKMQEKTSKRTDSNLKVAFQTAGAALAGLVGENPHLGLQAGAGVYHQTLDACHRLKQALAG